MLQRSDCGGYGQQLVVSTNTVQACNDKQQVEQISRKSYRRKSKAMNIRNGCFGNRNNTHIVIVILPVVLPISMISEEKQ